MQMFSASSVLFKTIKYIYMNNALNDGHVIFSNNFGSDSSFLKLILNTWKLAILFNPQRSRN